MKDDITPKQKVLLAVGFTGVLGVAFAAYGWYLKRDSAIRGEPDTRAESSISIANRVRPASTTFYPPGWTDLPPMMLDLLTANKIGPHGWRQFVLDNGWDCGGSALCVGRRAEAPFPTATVWLPGGSDYSLRFLNGPSFDEAVTLLAKEWGAPEGNFTESHPWSPRNPEGRDDNYRPGTYVVRTACWRGEFVNAYLTFDEKANETSLSIENAVLGPCGHE